MATVQLIDGRIIENAKLTDIQSVGDEGSRRATAHIEGKTYSVFNSIIDGFNPIWQEQISWETHQMLKGTSHEVVEGSATSLEDEKQPVWERDLMPGKDVVFDFYASELPDPERQEQAEWDIIPDHEMDSSVPGYPKLAPHKQWQVIAGTQTWMIYQWWSGTGYDDDEYLYNEITPTGPGYPKMSTIPPKYPAIPIVANVEKEMSEEDETQEPEEEVGGWKEYRLICGGVSKPAEEAIESVGGRVERLMGNFMPILSPRLYSIVLLYEDSDDDQGYEWSTDDGEKARKLYICSADAHHDLYILCADGSIPRFESDRSELRVITEGEWFDIADGPEDEKKA